MKQNGIRVKQYGLGRIAYALIAIASFVFCIGVYELLWLLSGSVELAYPIGLLSFLVIFGGLLIFDLRLMDRQMARDLDKAKVAIRRPLRNAVFGKQDPIDFDPHFPTVSPNGGVISAIDPRRRAMCWIACRLIDKDGNALLDGGHIDGSIVDVSQTSLPPKRRWLGLLPPKTMVGNLELSATVVESDGKKTTMKFRFRPDDRAAKGWRRTFEQWMYEDREART
jgi:hypothetical protein